ncbi:hypothetical protein GQ44DRAFT_716795 [Phaeosphaeriaceae sp. PMI808]|nr:hypothetical protein GQ44DRAFT_716795 [Phaeosphaeriaceae sp. PMI808]
MAARHGHLEIVRFLLDSGLSANTGRCPYTQPIIGAVESEHTGILRLLIERGANVAPAIPIAKERAEAMGIESMLEVLEYLFWYIPRTGRHKYNAVCIGCT